MRITDTGNVGIGTVSPETLMHIKGADTVTGVLKIEGGKNSVTSVGEVNARLEFGSNDASVNSTGQVGASIATHTAITNGAWNDLVFSTFKQNDPGLREVMRLDYLGRLGIGTQSPAYALDVSGDARFTGSLTTEGPDGGAFIGNWAASSSFAVFGTANMSGGEYSLLTDGTNTFIGAGNGGAVYLRGPGNDSSPQLVNNGTNIYMENAGSFGIGTSIIDSNAKFSVVSGSSAYTAHFSRYDADDGLFLHSEAQASHYNWLISTQDNVDKGFEITPSTGVGNRSFSTPAFVIKADTGNVGIGVASPSFSYGSLGLEIQSTGDTSLRLERDGSTAFEISARSSDVLIYNPGTARNFRFGIGGTEEFRMDTLGNFHADADVIAFSTTTASDIKFKENVKSIPYGLKEVLQMNPVEFDWIEKRNGTHDIGFIAQEMEKIVPEVIKETETLEVGGTHKTMDYAKLTSILVQAIQEQQEQINKLEEKLNG